jgi:5-methylcytosine-specific restriction endonuclease McrA
MAKREVNPDVLIETRETPFPRIQNASAQEIKQNIEYEAFSVFAHLAQQEEFDFNKGAQTAFVNMSFRVRSVVGKEGCRWLIEIIQTKTSKVIFAPTYQEYLKSDYWQTLREKAIEANGKECVLCGNSNDLNIHHRRYDNLGVQEKEIHDLTILCQSCHEEFHKKAKDNPSTSPKKEIADETNTKNKTIRKIIELWPVIGGEVKKRSVRTAEFLRAAKPANSTTQHWDNKMLLYCGGVTTLRHFQEKGPRQLLQEVFKEIVGETIEILATLDPYAK